MPVPGSYGWVLELCHGPQRDEQVLHLAVQTCEGLPRSNLSHTKARKKRLHSSSMSSTWISLQGVILHAAMLDSTTVAMSHSSFSRPTSRLGDERSVLWASPALSELFVLRHGDLEEAGRLHQRGHHCLPLLDLPVEGIQHLGPLLRKCSLKVCCSTSNEAHLRRRPATSMACSGATCCLTSTDCFFTLVHFSGNSCRSTDRYRDKEEEGQESDGLLKGLKHGVRGVLSVLHSQQVTQDPHQATGAWLLHLLAQAGLSHADELLQAWWVLWDAFLSVNLVAGDHVAVQKEVAYELLPVVHIQVAVTLQRVAKLAARCHDALQALHQEMTHVGQVNHVLHVSLRGTVQHFIQHAYGRDLHFWMLRLPQSISTW
ncbi:hypothetical protein EYF80_008042 [Liparis tanakae]|uniref:Uncharacterized protein n=1 Tax=Liparis tanakae TaxID=230148 RepID=A0A4Z2IUS4_9TELE|nr:hypothetical protein EYF80_008042 [Liparis tanakae]